MHYLYLCIAVIAEVVATTSLKAADGFSKPIPSAMVVIGYMVSFYLLTLVLQKMPLAITYTVWAGAGIVLVTLAGVVVYRQIPDLAAVLGIALIFAGIAVIQMYSQTRGI